MVDYTQYKNKGLTGLANLGNTCYINSSIQILSHIPELAIYVSYFLKENENKSINDVFLKEWFDLYTLMWSKNVIISPNRFFKVIQNVSKEKDNNSFVGYDQNDSTEFFYFIVQSFHESLKDARDKKELFSNHLNAIHKNSDYYKFMKIKHKDDYSFIDALFGTYVKIEYIDKETKRVLSSNFENFYIMDVAISHLSLDDCLKSHFSDEEMSHTLNNPYYDDKEKKYKDVLKRVNLYNEPPYLIIQLKRWNMNLKKNQRVIQYDPKGIHLDHFYHKNVPCKSKYELFGIINHSGNVFGGHYFSYIKGFNGKWYEFNDTIVKEIPSSKLLTNKNYCFIYRRNKK